MYAFRATLGPVDLAFTDRYGGVSAAPFDSLNLALTGDDDETARDANLRILLADFAPDLLTGPAATEVDRLAQMRQVHGCGVEVVDEATPLDGPPPEADALVTDRPDVVLLVRVADCVPVLLADATAGVAAVAHAGRSGVATGVVPAAVTRMRALGAEKVTAWVGPHVCGACYEVPQQLQAEVGAVVPETVATTAWGTPALDLGAGVRAQLAAAGVEVVEVAGCTRESADLFSHRRDGPGTGRQAGLIRIRR